MTMKSYSPFSLYKLCQTDSWLWKWSINQSLISRSTDLDAFACALQNQLEGWESSFSILFKKYMSIPLVN
jgi:hypothetical protein